MFISRYTYHVPFPTYRIPNARVLMVKHATFQRV